MPPEGHPLSVYTNPRFSYKRAANQRYTNSKSPASQKRVNRKTNGLIYPAHKPGLLPSQYIVHHEPV